MGRRHYVFGLFVRLFVRTYMRASWPERKHSPHSACRRYLVSPSVRSSSRRRAYVLHLFLIYFQRFLSDQLLQHLPDRSLPTF